MQGKEESKLQKELMAEWREWGFFCSKTHEMLSSGKPDLRTSHIIYAQLDVELKFKTSGPRGRVTGITKLQNIKLTEMNENGMPAIGLIWDDPRKKYFISILEEEDLGEIEGYRWIDPVIKRSPSPVTVYSRAQEFLRDRHYPSWKFIHTPFD